ncbi:MAG TPA: L-histidine N(alpha)-methyltransferase [Nitrosopumilaceae archaeon]|nr:L-histidine N(alpha)-methyltransferase [Nitrosopumilaceae archaeon]
MNKTMQTSLTYKKYVIDNNLQYFKPHSTKIEQTFADEITSGLNRDSKYINPKFFYDKKGSDLFEQICGLPEYYPTRTEIEILKNLKSDLSKYLDASFRLVELGSGSSIKTRLILDIFAENQNKIEYFPIDISEILTESSELLQKDYADLHITGIIDTYEGGLEFIEKYDDKKNLIIFLGSSFGNFIPNEGKTFLQKINSTMKKEDLFLIGLDLVKGIQILENAYNDTKGITSKFNLNVLSRINDELDADFVLNNFEHFAKYNEQDQRVEMYLKSLVNQSVIISKANLSLTLKQGELIHTEHSHKYKISQIKELMDKTGFKIMQNWLDAKEHYALILLSKK